VQAQNLTELSVALGSACGRGLPLAAPLPCCRGLPPMTAPRCAAVWKEGDRLLEPNLTVCPAEDQLAHFARWL